MITKITKQQTYLEKLKAIKAQYEALGYKLDKLMEAESGTPEEKADAFVTRDQAAKLLKCSVRQIDRLAQRYGICKYRWNGHVLIRKADIIGTQAHLENPATFDPLYPKIFDPRTDTMLLPESTVFLGPQVFFSSEKIAI